MRLEAQHLSYAYEPQKTVLHDVSLEVDPGETLYILGRNGGGKTTLLHCLAGLIKPDTGRVKLANKTLDQYTAIERAQRIGLIPQMHTPAFAYSVREMVMMGRAPHLGWLDSPAQEDQAIVEEALEQVGLYELRDRPYTEISGGERQLVLIARGLAQKCNILLMDEPTAHLDLSNQHRILEIINQLCNQGLSFIISSHAPNDALTYADNVLLLNSGWVTVYGPPQETLTEPLLSSVYGIRTEVIYDWETGVPTPRAVVPRRPMVMTPESLNDPNSLMHDVFEKSQDTPQLILVTGLSGAGKTSWCSRLINLAKRGGLKVGGILSPGIFKGQQKTGIEVKNLETGESRQLAKLHEGGNLTLSTPRWTFHPEIMDWANTVLEDSSDTDLLIIDELGPLEFLRDEGLLAGLERIDEGDYKVACVVVRSSLLPKALQRWPHALVVSGSVERE
jgi:iron complex transport system ATP-binding protein